MRLYALRHEDGSVSVMQIQDWVNHPVEHEIPRCAFSSPVVNRGTPDNPNYDAIPITEDQAAAIRAARPKPEVQASVTPVSGVDQAELRALQAALADMAAELADFRQFKAGLAQAIAEKKAQEIT